MRSSSEQAGLGHRSATPCGRPAAQRGPGITQESGESKAGCGPPVCRPRTPASRPLLARRCMGGRHHQQGFDRRLVRRRGNAGRRGSRPRLGERRHPGSHTRLLARRPGDSVSSILPRRGRRRSATVRDGWSPAPSGNVMSVHALQDPTWRGGRRARGIPRHSRPQAAGHDAGREGQHVGPPSAALGLAGCHGRPGRTGAAGLEPSTATAAAGPGQEEPAEVSAPRGRGEGSSGQAPEVGHSKGDAEAPEDRLARRDRG